MEKISKKIIGKLLIYWAIIFAVIMTAVTVSAKKVGDGYSVYGIQLGWVLIVLFGIIGFLILTKMVKLPKGTVWFSFIVLILFIAGIFMVAVDVPTATITDTQGLGNMDFDITASALTTAGVYYPDTTFDDVSNVFIVPFHANRTSDLLKEHGDNSTYSDDPVLQFVCDPDYPADATEGYSKIYFTITNPDLYVGSDPDNRVITETNDIVQLTWTDQDGNTDMVSGWASRALPTAITLNLTLNLYETGLAQSDVFDPDILYIKFYNADNTWSESYTVQFVCTDYWGT